MSAEQSNSGRNDICPCGSGRKFKYCCGRGADRANVSDHLEAAIHKARALREKGAVNEGLDLLQATIEKNTPDNAAKLEMARLKAAMGDSAAAIEWAREVTGNGTDAINANLMIGNAHYAKGDYSLALEAFEAVVKRRPESSVAQSNLANALGELGRIGEAVYHARKAVDLRPDYVPGWSNLGILLKEAGELKEAESALRRALELQPGLAEAERNLVTVLIKQERYMEARDRSRELVEAFPQSGAAWSGLGKVSEELGLPQIAREAYQRAVELLPEQASYFNGYLFALHYNPDLSPEAIHEEYLEWDRRYGRPLSDNASPPDVVGPPDRRLRIGFLSSSFNSHPVSFFTLSGLHHLPRDRFELVAFDNDSDADHVTGLMRREMAEWHDIGALDDAQLANRIRAEKIDILVDLIGHSKGSRLRAIARRPAPVIVKWVGGQLGSTGMQAFDWFITDSFESPPGTEHLYTERLLRLPDDYVCYTPPDYAPEVGELPALNNRYVTFACFNKLSKINDQLLGIWAQILEQVPDGRIMLKAKPLDDPAVCELVRDRFRQVGGDPDALALRGWSKHDELLATYNEVDIGLDSWPYSGGLTTCEALWMGVPVVSMAGPTFAGRHSWTHLSNAGLEDCLVEDSNRYISRAVEMARDMDVLARRRKKLRDQVASAPLCNGPRFAHHLATGLRSIWHQRMGGSEPLKQEPSGRRDGVGQGNETSRIQDIVKQAEQMLVEGNLHEAGQICLAAARMAPNSPDVLYLAGLINLASGHEREALDRLERALTARPWDARFNRVTAHALEALGDTDRAQGLGEVAHRLELLRRGDSGAALQSALIALETGQSQDAVVHLSEVKEDDAAASEALFLVHLMDSVIGHEQDHKESRAETESGTADSTLHIDARSDSDSPAGGGLPSEQVAVQVNAADGRSLTIRIPRNETFRLKNIFEEHEYSLPRELPGEQVQTVVDVGGNVGGFALYAKGWNRDAQVLCFEPNPQVLGMLEDNVEDESGVRVFPFALSAQAGEITLYQHPRNTGQSSVNGEFQGARPVRVAVEQASEAMQSAGIERIDVLKIDTEGSEVPILEGLGGWLQRTAVAMLEYHSEEDRRRIDELMAGFQLYDAKTMGVSGVGTVKYFNPALITFSR